MTFEKTGRLPGLPDPTPAQTHKVQIICGTIAGLLADSRCSDVERKAVVSNLVQQYGTLEQLSAIQRAVFRRKRHRSWKA